MGIIAFGFIIAIAGDMTARVIDYGMTELPATALNAIDNMFLWVPCGALVVSGIFYIMLNLSNRRVAEMRAEIAAHAEKTEGTGEN